MPAPDPLVAHWLAAASRPEVRADLESIYASAATAIAARGPACWASGRCCNFEKTGHLLYVTGLEAAYTVAQLPVSQAPTDGGHSLPVLDIRHPTSDISQSRRGDRHPICPFQSSNLCSVHSIRPLGCRLYFCDKSARQWQHDLSEHLLGDVRTLHDRHGVEYRYGEWRTMLAGFDVNAG